jgi:sulfopyruvate decarboxylase TPP-binding subunit
MVQASLILQEFHQIGVTDVVGLPDNCSAALIRSLVEDSEIPFHAVTREGEAFALAAGLWIGNRNPLVLIQNTGLLESGDSLRGTLQRMRIPVVCLITYRGFARSRQSLAETLDVERLSRPELDSVALLTEPTLKAWSLSFDFLNSDQDIGKLATAYAKAQEVSGPVALLLTQDTE